MVNREIIYYSLQIDDKHVVALFSEMTVPLLGLWHLFIRVFTFCDVDGLSAVTFKEVGILWLNHSL